MSSFLETLDNLTYSTHENRKDLEISFVIPARLIISWKIMEVLRYVFETIFELMTALALSLRSRKAVSEKKTGLNAIDFKFFQMDGVECIFRKSEMTKIFTHSHLEKDIQFMNLSWEDLQLGQPRPKLC